MDPKGEGHGKLVRNILDAKAEMEQPGEEEPVRPLRPLREAPGWWWERQWPRHRAGRTEHAAPTSLVRLRPSRPPCVPRASVSDVSAG